MSDVGSFLKIFVTGFAIFGGGFFVNSWIAEGESGAKNAASNGPSCPSPLKLGHYFVPVRGDYDGSETSFR